ncbi:MAG: hypothetical protein KTR31_02935 [Myxococcales bacterium]|nr:hypothetical protein [Myxococcales bacterium]
MWMLALSAQAATWTYRAPVPTQPPSDGRGFGVCLVLPVDLGIEGQVEDVSGNVSLTCSRQEERTRICYDVSNEDWPTTWEPLSCAGSTTTVVLKLVPAFDPEQDPRLGVSIHPGVDEVAASFVLQGEWPPQSDEDTRGTRCRIRDGRLWIWRDGQSRRKGTCVIRERDGTNHELTIRFRAPR